MLETVMVDTLEAEQRLCSHLDHLPTDYDMGRVEKRSVDFDSISFGASEYAKHGSGPIVETTGANTPWFAQRREIVDDIFTHAPYDLAYGEPPQGASK